MTDLISVVVTCYNHSDYIEQCLKSIFSQTYQNLELYIINDGSTDQSREIIESLFDESPFPNTQLLNQENQGIVVARNKGLEWAQGKYILFVDSDNYLPEDFIEKLYTTAQVSHADIVPTNLVDADNTDHVFMETRDFSLQDFFIGNFMDMCSLVRVSAIGTVRFDMELNRKKLVDYDFFLNLVIQNHAKVIPNKDSFVYYRILNDSMSDRENLYKYYQVYLYLLDKYFVKHPEEVKNALKWHLHRFLNLDVHTRIASQFVTVYFSKNGQYEESNVFQKEMRYSDIINFEIPEEVESIRVDLSEIPNYFSKVSLMEKTFETEIELTWTNARVIDGNFFFEENDPQIVYDLKNAASNQFILSYKLINPLDLDNSFSFSNYLIGQLEKAKNEVKDHDILKIKYNQVTKEAAEYRRQLEEMVVRYNSVTHSRRWTIPTKLINLFRRRK